MSRALSSTESAGPIIYENWKLALAGATPAGAHEYPLFSDAWFVGQQAYGPYFVLNPVRQPPEDITRPALYLRVEYYRSEPSTDLSRTDYRRYHGGDIADEVAALISLLLRARLQAGGVTREFFAPAENSHLSAGWPTEHPSKTPPALRIPLAKRPVLPGVLGQRSLADLGQINTLGQLSADEAVLLVRAARLYQNALWIAESEPENAWLALVSAVETVTEHQRVSSSLEDRFREWKPGLAVMLQKAGGTDLVQEVAKQLGGLFGSAASFREFIVRYLPEPPAVRPEPELQHAWDAKNIRNTVNKIYNWRSRALHGGTPFPLPMCMAPWQGEDKPFGLATGTGNAAWVAEDTPMLLHTFEYIVRGVLVNWWRSCASVRDVEEATM